MTTAFGIQQLDPLRDSFRQLEVVTAISAGYEIVIVPDETTPLQSPRPPRQQVAVADAVGLSPLHVRLIGAWFAQCAIATGALVYGSVNEAWAFVYGGAALVILTVFQVWRRPKDS